MKQIIGNELKEMERN